jgi:hypothetical protein
MPISISVEINLRVSAYGVALKNQHATHQQPHYASRAGTLLSYLCINATSSTMPRCNCGPVGLWTKDLSGQPMQSKLPLSAAAVLP